MVWPAFGCDFKRMFKFSNSIHLNGIRFRPGVAIQTARMNRQLLLRFALRRLTVTLIFSR
jgi:hypothetical protein